MDIKPLSDRVIVKRAEEAESIGGIIIPEAVKEKPIEGTVVAVGKGKLFDDGARAPMSVKVGDRVIFGKFSGTEIKVDGIEYLIVREDEILGVAE